MAKSNKILLLMVACAVVALGFGFYVMQSRTGPLPVAQNNSNPAETQQPETEKEDESTEETVIPTDWKVYTNDKHVFNLKYPPYLKAGSISDNSVLGTAQVPVRGYHVGPMVFVILKDAEIKKSAKELFDNVYNAAKNPPSGEGSEIPPIECKITLDLADKKVVFCNGEGGPATYAYISGTYDVFVDGYSKGYGNQDNGNLADKDFEAIVKTFSYGTLNSSIDLSTKTTTSGSAPPPPPSISLFTINANDDAATPSEIIVPKDTIAQITFNVGSGTYYGGLEFKSSVVNTGTINAGQSKTVSFKATQSFEFTPYWPASNVAKDYRIKVVVQ